jgi:hypothetical protein
MKPGDAAAEQGLALSFRPKGEIFFQFLCISLRDGQLLRPFGLESMRNEKTRLVSQHP